jgi:catechol 2,3-dioxygenase-like lactoylglutathione lyase family enzyme
MVKNGGNVLDAYGYVNVVSPCGLPMRGIVGIYPDPIMLVALNCANVEASRAFYEHLGFVEQEYPYARPSKGMGQFEPPQPPKSLYLAPSPNCMGVLLLQAKAKKKTISQNPVLESLNVVYTLSQEGGDTSEEMAVADPSGVKIAFQSAKSFEFEERASRVG